MIKDYVKTPEGVFVHDDEKGMYAIDYQDNIDKVLGIKHDIEVMQKVLIYRVMLVNKLRVAIKFRRFLQIFLGVVELLTCCFQTVIIARFIVSLIVMMGIQAILEIDVKRKKKEVKQSLEEIDYLEETIDVKEQKFKRLAEDDTADLTPPVEMKSFNYYEKKDLLEKKLNLLCFYKNCRELSLKEKSTSLLEDKKVEEFILDLIKK